MQLHVTHSTAEATTLQPARAAGHCVTRPSLATLGMQDSWLAYAAGPSLVATLNISACDAPSLTSTPLTDPVAQDGREKTMEEGASMAPWQSARLRPLESPGREELVFLHAHPSKNWLCAGTAQHGLYLTSLTHPLFTSATRLPLAATGELTYSACFLTHRPPRRTRTAATKETTSDRRGDEEAEEDDILAFSSAIKARSGLCASRLSLWHVGDRSLLYRGSMEPMHALCAFPRETALVGCAGPNVCYFAAYDPALKSQHASHNSLEASLSTRYRMRVSLSRCMSVEELSGAEYIQCAVCPKRDGTAADLFLALTSGGFLVAFDRASSAVLRWMDTKVSPATGLYATAELVFLTGNLVRFFGAERWEVRGKVRREAMPAPSPGSCLNIDEDVYSAALGTSRHFVLFSRGGEWSVYRMGNPAEATGGAAASATANGKSSKLSLRRCFRFAPIPAAAQEGLLWLLPSVPSSSWWGLWSPRELRLVTHELCQVRTVPLASTCAAFHKETSVLLTYDPATHSVVAYAAQDDWQECARLAMTSDDGTDCTVTALCCSTAGDACAALHAADSTITRFSCRWQYEQPGNDGNTDGATPRRSLQLRLGEASQHAAPRWQLCELSYLGGQLHAVTAQGALVNLETERELHCRGTPRALCAVGANAVVLSRDACEYYDTRVGELRLMRLPAQDLRHASYDAQSDLLAVGAAQLVLLYRLSTATVLYTVRSGGDGCDIRALALCTDVLQVRLLVCDQRGLLSAYEVESSAAPFRPSARTPREHSHSTAATSAASQATRLTSTLPMSAASHGVASQRVLRRAASAGAPSSRELSARLDALTSLFAQQKAGAAGRPHHRHGVTATMLYRSQSSTSSVAGKERVTAHERASAVALSTSSRSAASSRAASSEAHAAANVAGGPAAVLPDSPLRPVARDGLVGLPHDPVRVSASAAVEVSALTVDPRSSSAPSSLLCASIVAATAAAASPGRRSFTTVENGSDVGGNVPPPPTMSPVVRSSTPRGHDAGARDAARHQPTTDKSASRGETRGYDRLVLQSDDDDGHFFASAPDINEVRATPATPPSTEAGDGSGSHAARMSAISSGSTSSTVVVEQSRQLRESLRQWTSLLEHAAADVDASSVSVAEESASTLHGRPAVDEGEAEELHELSAMLTNALRVLQQRQTLSRRPSSVFAAGEDARGGTDARLTETAMLPSPVTVASAGRQDDLISVLVSEIGRIKQQNSRLERQNELILQKLSHNTTTSATH